MRAFLAIAALAACSSHAPPSAPRVPPDAAPAGVGPPEPTAKEPAPPTLRLPTSFAPTAYHASLVIDPAKPTFGGSIVIDAKLAAPSSVIWLDAEDLEIDSAQIGGMAVVATQVGTHFLSLRAPHMIP